MKMGFILCYQDVSSGEKEDEYVVHEVGLEATQFPHHI
jgi:hypothetical protein